MKLTFDKYSIESLDTAKGKAFFELIDSNRTRLEAYFPGTIRENRTLSVSLENMKNLDKRLIDKSYYPFVVIDTENQHYAGFVDVKSIDWRVPKGEVGYFVDQDYEGQGVISQALTLVGDYMASTYGFKKLLSRASPANIGSCRVAEKAGFILEGKIRNDFRVATGELVDMCYYGKVF